MNRAFVGGLKAATPLFLSFSLAAPQKGNDIVWLFCAGAEEPAARWRMPRYAKR